MAKKEVHNLMEDIVKKKLGEIFDSLNCCKCDRCRLDILTYTLNRLPPKYVASTQGELLSRIDSLDTSFEMSVIATITSAAEIIKRFPRHE